MAGNGRIPCEQRALGFVDRRVIAWFVTEPAVENDGPHHSEPREDRERHPPRHRRQHAGDEQRRERAAPSGAEPENALSAHPFLRAKPCREGSREIREATGLAHPEEEPHGDE